MSALWKHRPRFVQWLHALVGGYFWLPCSLCGRKFGGQEWHHKNQHIPVSGGRGKAICPWCAESGKGYY